MEYGVFKILVRNMEYDVFKILVSYNFAWPDFFGRKIPEKNDYTPPYKKFLKYFSKKY